MVSSLLLLVIQGARGADGPVVMTSDGPVQGIRANNVTTYHRIPFAAPPVGPLRWRYPQPPAAWKDPIKSAAGDPRCPQLLVLPFSWAHQGQEDCLYLSAYVPDGCSAAAPCPVMQWIYGGAWIEGADAEKRYDGTALAAAHGVVVVTANYRLDTLGWISLPEAAAEQPDGAFGNYGLADQRAALQWTQRNARALGGNPDEVTLFGESAGGLSVCQHVVSPASDGLFSRALMQSGDCDGPWLLHDGADAQGFGSAVATALGCAPNGDGAEGRMACLRALPVEKAMLPYDQWLCRWPFVPDPAADPWCNKTFAERYVAPRRAGARWPTVVPPFAPIAGYVGVVDGTARGLPDSPIRLIAAGKINRSPRGHGRRKIAVMLGTNTDELALFLPSMPLVIPNLTTPVDAAGFHAVAAHLEAYHDGWNATSGTARAIEAQYPVERYATQAHRLTVAGTDFCFRCGTRNAALALAGELHSVYLYQFDHHFKGYKDPATEACQESSESGCGVFHSSDVKFTWHNFPALGRPTDADTAMAGVMGQYFTNFAKHGNPNGGIGGGGVPVEWPKFDAAKQQHLRFGDPIEVDDFYAKANCDFWLGLPREGPYNTAARTDHV
jgi:carboxylesterase type B